MLNDLHNYLVGDVLSLLDKTTMACSIEGRVPLLNHRIVEFAFSIPESVNVYRRRQKRLFKEAMKGILPVQTLERCKVGFSAPVESWMRVLLKEEIVKILSKPNNFYRETINTKKILGLLQGKSKKLSARASTTLFSLFLFDS